MHKERLHSYMCGIAKNLNCEIISFNAMPDHVHILVNLHPEVSLAKFVGTVKQSSSLWLKRNVNFALFGSWAKEYYGVSVSPSNTDSVKRYIANQEIHHGVSTFNDEMKRQVESLGMQYYEDSFM